MSVKPLPTRDPWADRAVYERDLVAAIEDRLRRADRDRLRVSDIYPVGAVYLTENASLPAALSEIGGWSTPAEAATLGAPLGLNAFKRTG